MVISSFAYVAPARADAAQPTYGHVEMPNSCAHEIQPALQATLAKLHSFEADPSDFDAVARRDPHCALAFWGAAMSARGNPLAGAIDDASFRRGRRWLDKAIALHDGTPMTRALVGALDVYYRMYPGGHAERTAAYEAAMTKVQADFPGDPDVAAFTALSMLEAVDLRDTSYSRQRKAGAMIERAWTAHPDNPGLPHYLIHAYDYPALARGAIHAANVYPALAPASSHAQHMPSHIWSMTGEWQRSIDDNERSGRVADPAVARTPTAEDTVYDHAFDFIAYARLQLAQDQQVARDLQAMHAGHSFVVQARYALERDDWLAASTLPLPRDGAFDAAIARFSRALGFARLGQAAPARAELSALRALRPAVVRDEGAYWGGLVDIYAEAAEGWILDVDGDHARALTTLSAAADHDDVQQKHILLENKLVPIRELLGDMLLAHGQAAEAKAAYETSLISSPRRYRSFVGIARAAAAAGDVAGAQSADRQISDLTRDADTVRPAMAAAKAAIAR